MSRARQPTENRRLAAIRKDLPEKFYYTLDARRVILTQAQSPPPGSDDCAAFASRPAGSRLPLQNRDVAAVAPLNARGRPGAGVLDEPRAVGRTEDRDVGL